MSAFSPQQFVSPQQQLKPLILNNSAAPSPSPSTPNLILPYQTHQLQTNSGAAAASVVSVPTTPHESREAQVLAMLKRKLEVANQEKEILEAQTKRKLNNLKDSNLLKFTETIKPITHLNLKNVHSFNAHRRPVRAVSWLRDSTHFVSAADDNNLIIWNARTKLKEHFEPLKTEDEYVFACDISPDNSLIVCGGLNNHVSIFRAGMAGSNNSNIQNNNTNHNSNGKSANSKDNVINSSNLIYGQESIQLATRSAPSIVCRFKGHDDCISDVKFLNNHEILSASNDRHCVLWDLHKGTKLRGFADHLSDVTGLSLSPADPNLFLSSSALDSCVRLFDVREQQGGGLVSQFGPVGDDATAVVFHPQGNAFAVGTRDSALTLYDIRVGNIKLEEFVLSVSQRTQQQLTSVKSPYSPRFSPIGSGGPTSAGLGAGPNSANAVGGYTSGMDICQRRSSVISISGLTTATSATSTSNTSAVDVDGVESISFSNSGRVLFCCTPDIGSFAYDILKGEVIMNMDQYSSLAKVSPDGYAVLTASGPNHNMSLWTFM